MVIWKIFLRVFGVCWLCVRGLGVGVGVTPPLLFPSLLGVADRQAWQGLQGAFWEKVAVPVTCCPLESIHSPLLGWQRGAEWHQNGAVTLERAAGGISWQSRNVFSVKPGAVYTSLVTDLR